MKKIIEICCGSYEDAKAAYEGGATRIELNQALHLGGLTPSLGTLLLTKKLPGLSVIPMVRPRGAGFCYTEDEFQTMLLDCELLLQHGADGIAFGFLTNTFEIDRNRTNRFVELIHSFGKEAVFHRAFDCVSDPIKSIECLIDLQVNRLLTSGLESTAMDGVPLLAKLQAMYGEQIQLLGGSGLSYHNAIEFMESTKISQVHSSCKSWLEDPTTKSNHVSYAYHPNKESIYDVVAIDLVRKLINSI